MKIKETEEYIMITREVDDHEESFKKAFETGIVTLMVGKKSRRINGIKIWKDNSITKKG